MALKAGETLEEVFDVAGGQVIPNIIAAANDLVVWEAEEYKSVRNLIKRVVLRGPVWHARSANATVDTWINTLKVTAVDRIVKGRFRFDGIGIGFAWVGIGLNGGQRVRNVRIVRVHRIKPVWDAGLLKHLRPVWIRVHSDMAHDIIRGTLTV